MAENDKSPRSSIKTRSIALFAAYLFALCGVYLAFTLTLLQREATSANDRLFQTARMLAAETDSYIAAGRHRLATVATLPGLVYGLRSIREAKGAGHIAPWTSLHYVFLKSPVFTGGVFLVDDTGTVLWSEPPGREWVGEQLNDVAAVRGVFETKQPIVSSLQEPNRLSDLRHILLTSPIVGPEGEVVGVLGGVINVSTPEFLDRFKGISTEDSRFAVIIDQLGKPIIGTGIVADTSRSPGSNAPLTASAPMINAPWKVVAGQAHAAALADVAHLQSLLLAAGVLLAIVVIATGGPFVVKLIRSVRSLTHHAEVMASGNLAEPVNVASDYDEIITLGETFERMRSELERSHFALTRRLHERDELIRLKEEFLANVSHELRTPLNVIIGYTDMLLDDPRQMESEEWLRRIRDQSEHLYHLLQDLMTLAALNAGKISVEVQTVTIADMLSRLNPTVEACRKGRDIEVRCVVPDDLPALVTDPSRLEQVLANLINNAFKFTPQGRVEIRASHDRQLQRLVFEVADTGIGMPEEEIEHVFDEFRQIDGSMHRPHEGMGLGLALVRKLVTLLGGDVHVESHPHQGTTVTLSLPLQHSPKAAPNPARMPA